MEICETHLLTINNIKHAQIIIEIVMEQLMSLNPIVSPEAEKQAGEICKLIVTAISQNANAQYVEYTSIDKTLHPLVVHVLTTKGYKVEAKTVSPGQLQLFGYSPNNYYSYIISIC